ncbi:MAG: hypothetical protein AAGJ35_02370 [Myxococcota bacterium]
MSWRLWVLILLPFLLVLALGSWVRLPGDSFLWAVLLLLTTVILVFGHYRYLGALRSAGTFSKALRHLWLWRLLLPSTAFHRLRIEMLLEAEDWDTAARELAEAKSKCAVGQEEPIETAFLAGLEAEMLRRQGQFSQAGEILEAAIVESHLPLVRAGLLAQATRCLLQQQEHSAQDRARAEAMLDEAEELFAKGPQKLLLGAVRGELALAQAEYAPAATMLEAQIQAWFEQSGIPCKQPESPSWKQSLKQMVWGQKDEHQFPLWAELCASWARACLAQHNTEQARHALHLGRFLCQQPYALRMFARIEQQLSDARS